MQKKFWLFVVLAGVLAGCTAVDDTVRIVGNHADDIIVKFGDDIINNADVLIGTSILQSQDDVARTSTSYLDDLLRAKPVSQDIFEVATTVAQNTDDLPRISLTGLVDDAAPIVLYQNASQLSSLQDEVIQSLVRENNLSREDAVLQLQTICWISDYIYLMGEYPSSDYGLLYLHLEFILNGLKPESMATAEFAQQALDYAISWINNPNLEAQTIQQGAQLVTTGICMIASE